MDSGDHNEQCRCSLCEATNGALDKFDANLRRVLAEVVKPLDVDGENSLLLGTEFPYIFSVVNALIVNAVLLMEPFREGGPDQGHMREVSEKLLASLLIQMGGKLHLVIHPETRTCH